MALRVALAYGLIWFALVPGGAIRRFNSIGDYSYGLYILCFPILQTFVMLDPETAPWPLFFSSFPVVLALAMLSWHFVEHPALLRKARQGIASAACSTACASGSRLPSDCHLSRKALRAAARPSRDPAFSLDAADLG